MPAMTISESPGMGAILAQQDEIPDGPDVRGDRKAKVGLFSAVTAHYAHVLCCLCDGLAAPVAKIIRKGPRADMRYRDGVACWLQAPARSRHGAGWRRVYNPPSLPFLSRRSECWLQARGLLRLTTFASSVCLSHRAVQCVLPATGTHHRFDPMIRMVSTETVHRLVQNEFVRQLRHCYWGGEEFLRSARLYAVAHAPRDTLCIACVGC